MQVHLTAEGTGASHGYRRTKTSTYAFAKTSRRAGYGYNQLRQPAVKARHDNQAKQRSEAASDPPYIRQIALLVSVIERP